MSELENCLRRLNEIIELRNIMEELSKITSMKVSIEDIFREVSEINTLVGVARQQSDQA
jgi:hypothetical protein